MKDQLLQECLEKFTDKMVGRLTEKEARGYTGWNKTVTGSIEDLWLLRMILGNIVKGEWVDVANLAMFMWWRSGRGEK